ncbi:MAG: thiazole synthase [PVC group bacterium]
MKETTINNNAKIDPLNAPFAIADRKFHSRLMLGTGKFPSFRIMRMAIEASAAEIVTVALRRVDLDNPQDDMLGCLRDGPWLLLPNTSGARDAAEAVRLAKLSRAAGLEPWIKLEVTPDPRSLLPDPIETLQAAEWLVREGFVVLPYIQADPILAKRLEEVGCATVMPLAIPIGSNLGIRCRDDLARIISAALVPVVIDAGLGAPSQAAQAMEMGADAVLVNTAIATARDPLRMAEAFRSGVAAGRAAFLAGLPSHQGMAEASSPLTGFLRT